MKLINTPVNTAEANLALDEALLEEAETNALDGFLRIWESPVYFVVLGYSSHWQKETHADACKKDNVAILRRKSGGATVLQGPGCLNFSLILKSDPQSGIRTDTRQIMERNLAMANLWKLPGELAIRGISDLTWQGLKFSGNAMRRGKTHFLFHGTFLYDFNLEMISAYLDHPEREPEYRARRAHQNFLTNIPVKRETIIETLKATWQTESTPATISSHKLDAMTKEFYANAEWNLKY